MTHIRSIPKSARSPWWQGVSVGLLALVLSTSAHAQSNTGGVIPVSIITGRSLPITGLPSISKVTVVNPEIADVVVISENDVVFNAVAPGETDVILWSAQAPRRHYRVTVRNSAERRQIVLGVKFAEVRRDALRNLATSLRGKTQDKNHRLGAGNFRSDSQLDDEGNPVISATSRFFTLLSNYGSKELLGFLEAEETAGNARLLAEPNLMAANLEEASFLAGGEIPIPVVQGVQAGGTGGAGAVTIQFREFGVRLGFKGEVLSDSLLKLTVKPEVSSLDYGNSVTIQGFQIPALRTRKVESTVDVLSNRSLIISGLFNEERDRVKTGLPWLVNVPILGDLLSSQRWQRNESELIVIVTPVLVDPNNPRGDDLIELAPEVRKPAMPAIQPRLPAPIPPGSN